MLDEGHHYTAEWKTADERYEGIRGARAAVAHQGRLFGLSATPWRLKLTDKMRGYPWTEIIAGPPTLSLIESGWLADYQLRGLDVQHRIQRLKARRGVAAGWQDGVDAPAVWNKADDRLQLAWTDGAVAHWQANADNRPTVCFALSVAHADAVRGAFAAAGVSAEVVTGDTPPLERGQILDRFAAGETLVLVNVNVFREGFDCPAAAVLLCLRPTDSLVLWRQMVGRVMRPKPDGGKAVILDLTDNPAVFHREKMPYLPITPYAWSLEPRKIGLPGPAPEKEMRIDRRGGSRRRATGGLRGHQPVGGAGLHSLRLVFWSRLPPLPALALSYRLCRVPLRRVRPVHQRPNRRCRR